VSGRRSAAGWSGGFREAHWPLFVGLAATVIVLDQLTKAWILANLEVGRPIEIVGDLLRLSLSHNTGALFGLFRDSAPLFALFSIGVIGLILVYQARAGRNLYATVALGLLFGGAIGNLTDRIRLGYVVDFVDAGLGTLRWYDFNVADASISCAILLLVVLAIWPKLGEPGHTPARVGEVPGADG
jgi:signal peptidase II